MKQKTLVVLYIYKGWGWVPQSWILVLKLNTEAVKVSSLQRSSLETNEGRLPILEGGCWYLYRSALTWSVWRTLTYSRAQLSSTSRHRYPMVGNCSVTMEVNTSAVLSLVLWHKEHSMCSKSPLLLWIQFQKGWLIRQEGKAGVLLNIEQTG